MCDLSAKYTRELLLKNTQIQCLIEFKKNQKLFSNVIQGVCILEFAKANPSKEQSFQIAIDNAETQMDKIAFESISQKQILDFFPLYEFPFNQKGRNAYCYESKNGQNSLKRFFKIEFAGQY